MLRRIPENIPVLSWKGTISGRDGIELDSPRSALIDLLPLFERRERGMAGIHPSAVLSEKCSIGKEVLIGPCCVISDGARIGDRSVLQANVFVGRGVEIGGGAMIDACVVLQDFVSIGCGVHLHSGVVIGCDGFGFIPSEDGRRVKIPQIGTVVIEDDVEIGANSTIDRATFGTTFVRRGVKLGSLLHIAHNCDIGEDCVIAGCTGVGGSVTMGRGTVVAGMAGISDHVTIGDNVTVAGRSGVTKDIADGVTVSGFPAREHRIEMRFLASLRHITDYRDRLAKLERLFDKFKDKFCKDEEDI
jgi:UDP-3-O-[3-hydroxymyristoyl] glucosamine N-acyltransferase